MDIQAIAEIIAYVVTVASTITATTSTPRDDEFIGKAYKVIEFFALVNNKAKQR